MKKNNQGLALAISVIFMLFFAILTLPFVRQLSMAARHRVNLSQSDETSILADSAYGKAFHDFKYGTNTAGQPNVWQNDNLSHIAGWTLDSNEWAGMKLDGKDIKIQVMGLQRNVRP